MNGPNYLYADTFIHLFVSSKNFVKIVVNSVSLTFPSLSSESSTIISTAAFLICHYGSAHFLILYI